jgi:hypothetical protein
VYVVCVRVCVCVCVCVLHIFITFLHLIAYGVGDPPQK